MARQWTRREILWGAGALAMGAGPWAIYRYHRGRSHVFPIRRVGPNDSLGHQVRNRVAQSPPRTLTTKIAIIGGGVGGLSAAWRLTRRGERDFLLFELERELGGNSQSGRNAVSAFPWGAHYLPIPGHSLKWVRELLEEAKVIQGYRGGDPIIDEMHLCHYPQERLFKGGAWHEGLLSGNREQDKGAFDQFFAHTRELGSAVGRDGKKAFQLPLQDCSRDPRFLSLDERTMAQYLEKFPSDSLRWYVNYCCRDDFGTSIEQTSAWAGIHYFAAREGKAVNAERGTVLTWPEGNGFLVGKLRGAVPVESLHPRTLALRVRKQGGVFVTLLWDDAASEPVEVRSEKLIFAAPAFVARHVLAPELQDARMREVTYAPWLVANLTVEKMDPGIGAPLSWDNVIHGGQGLGYVVANHQSIRTYPGPLVLTYYWPLSHLSPEAARKELQSQAPEVWAERVIADIAIAHPRIRDNLRSLDLWYWAHGMVRPAPGFLWKGARFEAGRHPAGLYFAHSDLSGISLFEEAQAHGVRAADAARGGSL